MADAEFQTDHKTERGAGPRPPEPAKDARYYTGADWPSLLLHLLENIHWIVMIAFLCAAAAGLYASCWARPLYRATAKLYIAGVDAPVSLPDVQLGTSLAADYQEAFQLSAVQEMVSERLGLAYSREKLAQMIAVSSPLGSHFLYITAQASLPEEAKRLANAFAEAARDFIGEKMELPRPRLMQEAGLPTAPASPKPLPFMLRAFLLGGLGATAVVVFQYLMDDRIRTRSDIEKTAGLPVLGALPVQELGIIPENGFTSYVPPGSAANFAELEKSLSLGQAGDETINAICSAIRFAGKNAKKLAVTSHDAGEGKTFLAVQIARGMANRGMRVLLMEGDLRKAPMGDQYGIKHTPKGLVHLLSGQGKWKECVYATAIPNLYLLPAGEGADAPLALLASGEFQSVMKRAGKEFDLVIVDTPPVGAFIDAAEIAKRCDGSILVLAHKKQTKSNLRETKRILAQTETPVLGCIINKAAVKRFFPQKHSGQEAANSVGGVGKKEQREMS